MALVLYDNAGSSNALKVRVLLAELALDAERIDVPFAYPRPEALVALNPLGEVPTLVDGETVIAESNAILRYLARREARDDLYPADAIGAAQVDTFLDRWSLTIRPALGRHEMEALGYAPGKGMGGRAPDHAAAERIAAEIAPTLGLLESLVHPWGTALGAYTICDAAAVPALFRTTLTGLDLGPYPRIARWRDTLLARPAFAAAGAIT